MVERDYTIVVLGKEIPVTQRQAQHWPYVQKMVYDMDEGSFIPSSSNPDWHAAYSWLKCPNMCCKSSGRTFLEALAWIEVAYKRQRPGSTLLQPIHDGATVGPKMIFINDMLLLWNKFFGDLDNAIRISNGGLIEIVAKEAPEVTEARKLTNAELIERVVNAGDVRYAKDG